MGLSLLQGQLKKRTSSSYVPRSLRQKASKCCGEKLLSETTESLRISKKRGRRDICPRNNGIKTKISCQTCKTFMCLNHMDTLCKNCIQKNQSSTEYSVKIFKIIEINN